MKEKYLNYLYKKVLNEADEKESTANEEKSEKLKEIKKSFGFDFSEENNLIIKELKNKSLNEIEQMRNMDSQISDFLDGKIYLYEITSSKRSFYFVNENKIYAGKFIDIPNSENDLYEIIFAQTNKIKTQDLKETEKLTLNVNNVKILSKIYLIIITCPYFKRENNSVFYFSTVENSNFKSNSKDKSETENIIENYINDCEEKIKKEINDFTELLHANDITESFDKLRYDILEKVKNVKVKNKIYENFMNSVESNLNMRLNKYTFNYKRKDKIKVCVAFSKNKSVSDIRQTIESADHKFKNN
jgi:hypothetical protein